MRVSHQPEDQSDPYLLAAVVELHHDREEYQKALQTLKNVHNEIFNAGVSLSAAKQKGATSLSTVNIAELLSSLAGISNRLRCEMVVLGRKLIEQK